MKRMVFIAVLLGVFCGTAAAVQIIAVSGEVQVRRGMNENWQIASVGELLDDLDTILVLEGQAILLLPDDHKFILGSHSLLDIGDLRTITRQELFLYLMQAKVDRIQSVPSKMPLRMGNVSVVHGENRASEPGSTAADLLPQRRREINGARALYAHQLYANSVLTLHKILRKYALTGDCGECDWMMGQAFEALGEAGQAIDAYEQTLSKAMPCSNQGARDRVLSAKSALERLRSEQETAR